jgi:IS5 family transposase
LSSSGLIAELFTVPHLTADQTADQSVEPDAIAQAAGRSRLWRILPEPIDADKRAGVINALSAKRVIVDTRVTAKADAIPIDSRFIDRRCQHWVMAATHKGLTLRRNHKRWALGLGLQIVRYAHAKFQKRMKRALRSRARSQTIP